MVALFFNWKLFAIFMYRIMRKFCSIHLQIAKRFCDLQYSHDLCNRNMQKVRIRLSRNISYGLIVPLSICIN